MAEYIITKEECEENISGVCEACGGKLSAFDTVDNAGRPTFWQGCEHCQSFRGGIDLKYFLVARRLIDERIILPYSHMKEFEYKEDPIRLQFWVESQTAGLASRIKYIETLLLETR